MDNFGAVRKLAREKHAEMRKRSGGDGSATALLNAARTETKAVVRSVSGENPLLDGGFGALHRPANAAPAIYLSSELAPDLAAYVEAHEYGHLWIETPTEPAVVSKASDPGAPEENSPTGIRRVEAYSPEELRERYANVFAREFLLPGSEAKRLFAEGKSAKGITRQVGVPLALVNQQLAVSLLLPEVPDAPERKAPPPLDDSQRAAAEHEGSPLLVEAGPGTGKTRTLIRRIEFLLAKAVPPAGILVLTFSNKAAREIRERVALTAPSAAAEIWAGTFHAFGLEFLRKFGSLDHIAQPVRLLDQADQLQFLESELSKLDLDHYLWLSEPAYALRHILGAISRAKDEVAGPDEYEAAASNLLAAAGANPKLELDARKAQEVARVFRHYERRLREDGVVDFADLINRPLSILRKHRNVIDEVRGQYAHVLVDEYQDVNRASALLLKELARDGKTLWVVGDARQSIYRFRGAAPTNVANFGDDFPGSQFKSLGVNYRSRRQIVDTFVTYANDMEVAKSMNNGLAADRGDGQNAVDFNVATDGGSEISGLAEAIHSHRAEGRGYSSQAILCRGHSHLRRIATGLEALGIPVLNLGDLFERPEVRDLLSLISFTSEPHRRALMRVATLPRYQMGLSDVSAFYEAADAMEKTPMAALAHVNAMEGVSADGKEKLQVLGKDLEGVGYKTGPGHMLFEILFERGLIREYLHGDTAADQQRRLAIHQFLQFAAENNGPTAKDPKRQLLDWIRRLAVFGDDRSLREMPAAVEGIDAVRIMTVHMSKGLEFPVVHLPCLGNGMFPLKPTGKVCKVPEALLAEPPDRAQADEEQCLFFVALSRAKDHISLSRAERYSERQRSNPSPALPVIRGHLPRAPDADPTWTKAMPEAAVVAARPDLKVEASEHKALDIETYDECPRRYLYEVVLGLSRSRQDNAYVRFHRTVYRVLRWLTSQRGPVSADQLKAEFDARWAETGPSAEHPLEAIYRSQASAMIERESRRPKDGIRVAETISLKIAGRTLQIGIDEMDKNGRTTVVRRLRTGRPRSDPDHRMLHALMLHAVRQTDAGASFEIRYLAADEEVPISFDRVMQDRLKKAETALKGLGAGDYPPKESEKNCPRCPHYFICSAVPN